MDKVRVYDKEGYGSEINCRPLKQTAFFPKWMIRLASVCLVSLGLSAPSSLWGQSSFTGNHLRLSLAGSASVSTGTRLPSPISLNNASSSLHRTFHTTQILPQMARPSLQVSRWYLPDYARNNPANWAPLCHLEADIEKKLPIGIWINWEESDRANSKLPATADIRFRLLSF